MLAYTAPELYNSVFISLTIGYLENIDSSKSFINEFFQVFTGWEISYSNDVFVFFGITKL